jgi:hypothetical protein
MDAINGPHIKILDPAAASHATTTSIDAKSNSFSKEQTFANGEAESIFDEEIAGRRESDYKRKQVYSNLMVPNIVLI